MTCWSLTLNWFNKDREPLSSTTWKDTFMGAQVPVVAGTAFVSIQEVAVGGMGIPPLDAPAEPWQEASDGRFYPAEYLLHGHEPEPRR